MKNAGDLLKEKAELYRKKGLEYGHSYHQYGDLMKILHPEGFVQGSICVEFNSKEFWNVIGVWQNIIHKILRIANTGFNSLDSIRDLQVYAAMLEEVVGGSEKINQDSKAQ